MIRFMSWSITMIAHSSSAGSRGAVRAASAVSSSFSPRRGLVEQQDRQARPRGRGRSRPAAGSRRQARHDRAAEVDQPQPARAALDACPAATAGPPRVQPDLDVLAHGQIPEQTWSLERARHPGARAPRPRGASERSGPAEHDLSASIVSTPEMQLTSVVFPDPFGPIRPEDLALCRARRRPPRAPSLHRTA